jgi:hypothetical protein
MTLSDLLIELSEPKKADEFARDPEAVIGRAGLSEADKAALRSRQWGWIHYQARGEFPDPEEYAKAGSPIRFAASAAAAAAASASSSAVYDGVTDFDFKSA